MRASRYAAVVALMLVAGLALAPASSAQVKKGEGPEKTNAVRLEDQAGQDRLATTIDFAAALGLVFACQTSGAAEFPRGRFGVPPDRLVWRHPAGHFENTEGNRWVELSLDGRFVFQERFRGPSFIELYDGSRDCWVRLTSNACFVRFGAGPYRLLYNGHWER